MARNSNRPEIGEFLGSNYRVTRVLSEGSRGVLFEAVNVRLGQRVALELPLPEVLEQPALVERFAREARAAVRLRSRNSVRVLDVDATNAGVPFMVMELLDGRNLESELAEHGPLPVSQAVGYVLQACSALIEAHSHGIVHRDLKPSRLFLSREPDGERCIKVLGLGISSLQNNVQLASLPHGTPLYVSPEQLLRASKAVDARSDVWSLGAILYELLSGTPPFVGSPSTPVDVAILEDTPESLQGIRADVPAEVEAAVFKAMAKQAHDRFASVRDLMLALTPHAQRNLEPGQPGPREAEARVDAIARSSPPSLVLHAAPSVEVATARPRWRMLAVGTPLLVTISALYVTQCDRSRDPSEASQPNITTSTLALTPGTPPPIEQAASPGVSSADDAGAGRDVETSAAEPRPPSVDPALVRRTAPVPASGAVAASESGPQQPSPDAMDAPRRTGLSNAPGAAPRGAALRSSTPRSPTAARSPSPRSSGLRSPAVPDASPLEAGPSLGARGPTTPSPSAKPSDNPAVRPWDEDSPVPP